MPFRMADTSDGVAVIKVIGIGGGGGNAINNMVDNRLKNVEFLVANTDKQALDHSKAETCLQLGPSVTKGLGAGANPEQGAQAALESLEDIKSALSGSDMVFVTAGLGGGTGSGAAPIIAKVSKELGALTVAVVTKPFHFEGKMRMRHAQTGWEELRKYADTIITVPNDRLLSLMQKNSKLSDMLGMADTVLLQAVKGITDLINVPGLINVDFADLRTVMKEEGPAIMGSGSAVGENRATEAAKRAIDNQLLEDVGIDGARGLLVNISATEESFTMSEFMDASALIHDKVDDEATAVVIGALYDDSLGEELHVTVIATGVGELIKQSETITQITGKLAPRGGKPEKKENPVKTQQAAVNAKPHEPPLPGSNFEGMDPLASSRQESKRAGGEILNLSEDLLETPTYLRKKAN